ncbi:MAG: radical SAM protein [Treponema sp.]|nr:radical SAM protein [Treponema sp.]
MSARMHLQKLKQKFYYQVIFFYIRISAPFRLRPRKLLRFETDIVGHCNLKCRGCNHFSPLVKEEFVSLDVFERDFARLSELAGRKNENIDLMGGEPLMHPEIVKITEIARKYFDGPINIVTNGLLLIKMTEEFWKSCQKYNIKIIVTSYPIQLDRKLIRKTAKKYSVKIKIRLQVMGVHTWCRLPKDLQGRQDINKNIKLCLVANFCIYLKDGKLSTCCLPLVADRFNNFFEEKLKTDKNDYIDIYAVKNIDEIFNFLCKPIPFCRYCKLQEWEVGVEWGPSKNELSEWVD